MSDTEVRGAVRVRQIVDWDAAVWAGLIAGVLFLVVVLMLTAAAVGDPWIVMRILASPLMGGDVLSAGSGFDPLVFAIGLLVHLVLSVLFAFLLAVIVHRWGLIVATVVGALFGLGLYAINFYAVGYLMPWFYLFRSWMMLVAHVTYGAAAGFVYEALETETYVPVEG